jgi:N-acetylglucosamine transport system permease protein
MMSLAAALLLDNKLARFKGFFRTVYFAPVVTTLVAVAVIWRYLFNTQFGLINWLLGVVGLGPVDWLGNPHWAMPAIVVFAVWKNFGYNMIILLAGLQAIPDDLYEAARIDGAGRFRTMTRITIPMIRDNIQTAYIYMGILSLDAFVYMVAMNPGGGPNNSTLVMAQQLFSTAFTQGKFGLACAMGVVLAAITLTFAGLVFVVNWLTGGHEDITE